MPEKMTKEEVIIAMAIKKAREVKSALYESTQIMPYDHKVEVVKIKRPKAQNVKIKNQTQKKEGYGLAGETLKKEDKMVSVSRELLRKIEMEIQLTINLAEKRNTLPDIEPLKEIVSQVKKLVNSSYGL
jgi:23S rRNA pseudoU1915 N3-methylase RlmH